MGHSPHVFIAHVIVGDQDLVHLWAVLKTGIPIREGGMVLKTECIALNTEDMVGRIRVRNRNGI